VHVGHGMGPSSGIVFGAFPAIDGTEARFPEQPLEAGGGASFLDWLNMFKKKKLRRTEACGVVSGMLMCCLAF
jgi:hypothetical protein